MIVTLWDQWRDGAGSRFLAPISNHIWRKTDGYTDLRTKMNIWIRCATCMAFKTSLSGLEKLMLVPRFIHQLRNQQVLQIQAVDILPKQKFRRRVHRPPVEEVLEIDSDSCGGNL